MLNFLKPYWLSIVKWAAIVGGGLLVFFKIRQSGRDAERVRNLEKVTDNAKKAAIVKRGVANSSGGHITQRLRNRWTRD